MRSSGLCPSLPRTVPMAIPAAGPQGVCVFLPRGQSMLPHAARDHVFAPQNRVLHGEPGAPHPAARVRSPSPGTMARLPGLSDLERWLSLPNPEPLSSQQTTPFQCPMSIPSGTTCSRAHPPPNQCHDPGGLRKFSVLKGKDHLRGRRGRPRCCLLQAGPSKGLGPRDPQGLGPGAALTPQPPHTLRAHPWELQAGWAVVSPVLGPGQSSEAGHRATWAPRAL